MKIRTGFVSNSSSSSFVIAFNTPNDINPTEFMKSLEFVLNTFPNPPDLYENLSAFTDYFCYGEDMEDPDNEIIRWTKEIGCADTTMFLVFDIPYEMSDCVDTDIKSYWRTKSVLGIRYLD